MCSTELMCLQEISLNILHIKAFCYALGVALALLVAIYFFSKIVSATIGQAF